VTNELVWLKDGYWAHRDVVWIAAAVGSVALVHLVLVLWMMRSVQELSHIRERMSRLADGLALLTDTTEAGLATLIREVEQLGRRTATTRAATRTNVAKRVIAAAKKGDAMSRIAETESLSESEVRLHLTLAEAAKANQEGLGLKA